MMESEVGVVINFFDKVGVAAINIINGSISAGDTIHIKGRSTDITSTVESMQIGQDKVQTGKKGDSVGIKIGGKARAHDRVFKITV